MGELPQLRGGFFLTDAGLETDLIFNHGHDIPSFAAHTLLASAKGRLALETYFRGFLDLARDCGAGFVLDLPTWRAQRHFASELGISPSELQGINQDAIEFGQHLRDQYKDNTEPILLNGLIGPRGDAYAEDTALSADDAESYHSEQLGWFAEFGIDMVTALTLTSEEEAIGIVRATSAANLPVVISFTVETDGRLPTGSPISEAIQNTDSATDGFASYYMVNCAHPEHFRDTFTDERWVRRIRGFRCNASRKSHAELDASESLDAGDPFELADDYRKLRDLLPWANVFGGCCGTDLKHVTEIAKALQVS